MGLQSLHAASITHASLNPNNVFVLNRDQGLVGDYDFTKTPVSNVWLSLPELQAQVEKQIKQSELLLIAVSNYLPAKLAVKESAECNQFLSSRESNNFRCGSQLSSSITEMKMLVGNSSKLIS